MGFSLGPLPTALCPARLCPDEKFSFADVVFVVDTSKSVDERIGESFRKIIRNYMNMASYGPDDTQVSVVTYSNQADLEIKFNDYDDKQKFYKLLNDVDFLRRE